MFGYVTTDLPNMYVKDTVLYKAMYCGLCKSIGKSCGAKARLALNYDLTFLSVFIHNLLGRDVKVQKERCVIHWLTKRPVATPDEISKRIGALNVILAYYKFNDDVMDNNKGRLAKLFFKSSYKKAQKQEPRLDEIVKYRYAQLVEYEKTGGDSIDMASDPFGNMMVDVVSFLLGEKINEDIKVLSYNLGKWIYLIDALDDFDKDVKKKNFNVLVNAYKDVHTKSQLIEQKREELVYVFGTTLGAIMNYNRSLPYQFNHDLIDNVLNLGLNKQTKRIMENKKCKNSIKY